MYTALLKKMADSFRSAIARVLTFPRLRFDCWSVWLSSMYAPLLLWRMWFLKYHPTYFSHASEEKWHMIPQIPPRILQKWLLAVLKRILGVRDTTLSWCVVRECGREPLQFNWFRAAMRLYKSLTTQCNSSTMSKVLQADMQVSSKPPECWSSHILSAMEGLTHV
jgi:hypothetical protein